MKGVTMRIRTAGSPTSRRGIGALLVVIFLTAAVSGCAGAGVKTGQYVDDTAVTTKVKSKLATDETVSALDVHVETVKGTVRLSGFVKNPDHKRRAEQLAWSVEGVHSVDNGLVVQNP
jgi:osmotically-inducible protein OsmY